MHVDTRRAPARVASPAWLPQSPSVLRLDARPATKVATHVKIPGLSTVDRDRAAQRLLIFCYATCTVAAVLGWLLLPPSLTSTTGVAAARVWALFTLLGSGGCLAGVLMPRGARGDWVGEYVSIPLLSSTIALYGAAIVWQSMKTDSGRAPAGVLLLGLVVLLAIRWRVVRAHSRSACPPTSRDPK